MKIFILAILWQAFAVFSSAQETNPKIKVFVNNQEINYQASGSEIHPGDSISFSITVRNHAIKYLIDGYTARYFDIKLYASKMQRQEMTFTQVMKFKDTKSSTGLNIDVDDLIKLRAFTKLEIELGKIYTIDGDIRTLIPYHSSQRSFEFMFFRNPR